MDITNAVCDGLTALYLLKLPNTPAQAKMEAVTGVWLSIFADHCRHWEMAQDQGRLEAAFARMLAEAERWPTPKDIIDRIPSRPAPKPLPRPPRSREQQKKNREIIKKLSEILHINKE